MTTPRDNTPKRLGRITGLCVTGQTAAAELDLSDWLREDDCPPAVRTMLAALLARRGQHESARCLVADADRDPLEMLTLLSLLTRDRAKADDARRLVERLHSEFGHVPFVRRWLALTRPPGFDALPPVGDGQVEQLAGELVTRPTVVRSLVVAQQYEPNPQQVQLLRCAIERIAPAFAGDEQLGVICQALAELAELAGDIDDARRWAHRGLKADPFNAMLALVLSRIDDDANVGPDAADVLDQMARRHPTYPDVRAALIRRLHADGQDDDARHRLAAWLENEPASDLARRLHQELERAA